MNILFLTLLPIEDFSQRGMYPDLINEFAEHDHDTYVVSPSSRISKSALLKSQNHVHLLSVLLPDYFGNSFIKKGIASLIIGYKYLKAIEKLIPNVRFDLILYSTPPITFCDVIEKIKKRDNAFAYLLLKDIWPQGLIDSEVLTTKGYKGLILKYLKRKEQKLYSISDFIGCMSEANREYLIRNSGIKPYKIEICPNAIKIRDFEKVDRFSVRSQYELPLDKTVFVYGGNLGLAQGIDFIISVLEAIENVENVYILIVGAGTQFAKLENWFIRRKPKNSKLIYQLPHDEYMKLISACDIGLIFLAHHFTIPNVPSRLLSYMQAKLPVLACTDPVTDIGKTIVEGGFGWWCESNKAENFVKVIKEILETLTVTDLKCLGQKAYKYLEENYSVENDYQKIMAVAGKNYGKC